MRSLLLSSLLLVAVAAHTAAQQRVLEGRATVTSSGFLTLRGGGEAGAVLLYSATGEYSGTIMFGVALYDVLPLPSTPPNSLILAAENGRLALYRSGSTPSSAERIWHGTLPAPGRLLGPLRDIRGAQRLYAIASDSGCAIVDSSGTSLWTRHTSMLYTSIADGGSILLTLEREGGVFAIHLFDAATGSERKRVDLRVSPFGSVLPLLLRVGDRDVIAIAGTQPGDTALALDAVTLAPRGGTALHGMPIGIVRGERDGTPLPLCIVASGGVRGSWIENGGGNTSEQIDWPFEAPPLRTIQWEEAIAIASYDSIALYDRTLSPLGKIPAPHAASHIERLLDGRLLITGDQNSLIVPMPVAPTWLERRWPQLVLGALLLVVLAVILSTIRRDRYTRTLHDNLVRLPDAFGVLTVDSRRRMRSINGTARRLLGTPEGLRLGTDVRTAIGDELAPALLPHIRTLIDEGTPFAERFEMQRDEPMIVMVRGRALVRRGGGTGGVLLLIEDITESVRQENLVNWASVAHHIAHEMKTPLGAVAITAETLHERLRETGIEGDMLRATRRILRQAGRLRGIVSDLLTIARADSLRPVDADLALLLGSIVDDLGESIPPSVTVTFRTEGGANFRLPIDVEQMTSALRNIIDNAWQAIGPRDDGRIEIVLRGEEERLVLLVNDNGIGMTPETQANLFRPFYTLKHGGSGIGTVIIKRVIEGHGGTIRVESAPGQGTQFVITLPRKVRGGESR